MKKYILYALLILVHSSCSKEFTELTPISERNIQSAYKTEADFAVRQKLEETNEKDILE